MYLFYFCLILMLELNQCSVTYKKKPVEDLIVQKLNQYEADKSIGQLSIVKNDNGSRSEYPQIDYKENTFKLISYVYEDEKRVHSNTKELSLVDVFRFGQFYDDSEKCSNQNRTILTVKQPKYTNSKPEMETIYVKPDGCEKGTIIKRIHLKTNDTKAVPIYVYGETLKFFADWSILEDEEIYVSVFRKGSRKSIGQYRVNEINIALRQSYLPVIWQTECYEIASLDTYITFGLYYKKRTIYELAQTIDCLINSTSLVTVKRIANSSDETIYTEREKITLTPVTVVNGTENKLQPISIIPTRFGLGHRFDAPGKCNTDRRKFMDGKSKENAGYNKKGTKWVVLQDGCEHGAYYTETNINTNRDNLTSDVPIYLQTDSILGESYWRDIINSDYLILTIERHEHSNNTTKIEKYTVHEIDVFFRFDPKRVRDPTIVAIYSMELFFSRNGFDKLFRK